MNSIELNSNRDGDCRRWNLLFRFANRCVPRFFQGCERRDGDRRRDSALSSVAGASYHMQRVAASTVVSACSGQIAREREEEKRTEEASEGRGEKRSVEWNSELTRRREITALSLPRLSCTLHRDCVVQLSSSYQRYRRTRRKDAR